MNLPPSLLARIVFAVAICGSRAPAVAQEPAFIGRVVDERSQAGVAGATVSIPGYPGTARTGDDGRFTWSPRPAAPFQVIVLMPAGQVAGPVTIESESGDVLIHVNPLANESLTVVGVAPSITTTAGAATTLLSSRQIAQRTPEHLLQALETVPGVSPVSEGHAAVPAIRGLARGRTLLLIDGGRVSSERRVGASATFADPALFEGIDVARGPGSVAYGSDALGGVISVRTRRAEPGSPLRIRGSVTLGAGIPERRGVVEISKGLSRGGVILQTHARAADDWNAPGDREVLNSGWKDRGVAARGDYQLGQGILSVGLQSDFGRDIERPRNDSHAVRFYYPSENSHRLTSSYEVSDVGGFQQLATSAFIGTFEQRTDQDRLATASTGRRIERADIAARDLHLKGSATRKVGAARVEFGVDVNGRYGLNAVDVRLAYDVTGAVTNSATNISVDTAARTDVGAYAQADLRAAKYLRLSGGVRGDHVTTRNVGGSFGDRSTSNAAVSGFAAGMAGPFRGMSFTGQLSRGFRDPTLSDRYYRGPTGRGFVTGNPDLSPETSLQYDLAARYVLGSTHVAAYYYHYRIDELVERYQAETDFFFFRNRGRARMRGFEVEARTAFGGGMAVEFGASTSRGSALDENADLDDMAPDTLSVLFRKEAEGRGFAQIRAALLARDDRPGPSEITAPGASLVDLAAGYTLTRNLELRANVRNVLDDAYYASPDPRWVYAPGRSASVTLAVQF